MPSGFRQFEATSLVAFKLLDTAGTPSIIEVFPPQMAANISVVDTATGRATVTIKNFKGRLGYSKMWFSTYTTSMWASAVTRAYSGNDLSFEISIENDASTLSDDSVDVLVLAH